MPIYNINSFMRRSDLKALEESYIKIIENKLSNKNEDGLKLSPREIDQIKNAISSNDILKGIKKVFRPNDFIQPLSEVLKKVGFELDTPVNGFLGSYGKGLSKSDSRLLRIRKINPNNTDPHIENPIVSDDYTINVTASWLGREGMDEMKYDRPMYEIIAYLAV